MSITIHFISEPAKSSFTVLYAWSFEMQRLLDELAQPYVCRCTLMHQQNQA